MNYSVSKIQLLSSGVVVFEDSRGNILHTDKNLKQFIPKGTQYIAVDCSCQDMFFDVWRFEQIITPIASAFYAPLDKYTASQAEYKTRLQEILSFLTENVTKACCESPTSSEFIPFPYSYSSSGVSSGDWNYGSSGILTFYSISLIGQDLIGYLSELDNGGYVTLSSVTDPTTFSVFRITSGSYLLASGIITFTGATLICSGGTFVEGDRSALLIDLGGGGSGGGVQTVTGDLVDNTDPSNPIIDTPTFQETLTEGSTLTGDNTVDGGGFNFTWNAALQYLINATLRIIHQVTSGSNTSFTRIVSTSVQNSVTTSAGTTILATTDVDIEASSTNPSFTGIIYQDDYHSNYTNRSLPAVLDTQRNRFVSGNATGTNTYSLTLTPAITGYHNHQAFDVIFTNANTGASTLNVNGLGAVSILKNDGTLLAGDIAAGSCLRLMYDGTNFKIVGTISQAIPNIYNVAKVGDQNNTVTQPTTESITGLSCSLDANSSYRISVYLRTGCNNTGGLRIGATFPTGSTITAFFTGTTTSATAQASAANAYTSGAIFGTQFNAFNNAQGFVEVIFQVDTAGTAGTFQMIFAGQTAGQVSTIYGQSNLIAMKY